MMKKMICTPLLLAACLFLVPASVAAEVELQVLETEISQPGWTETIPFDINDRSDVVGYYDTGGPSTGFLYSGGTYTDIIPPGWANSTPVAISENGRIAGSGNDGGTVKGFLYSSGTYTTLIPPGWTSAGATDVNDSGEVVGTGNTGFMNLGFFYDGGVPSPVLPPGYTSVHTMFISNSGLIVGAGSDGAGGAAFMLDGGFSPIAPPGWTNVDIAGINNSDEILGRGSHGGLGKCFIMRGGTFETISFPDAIATVCFKINNGGAVLGWGLTGPTNYELFIYRDGRFHIVGPGIGYFIPSALNGKFEILGYAVTLPSTVTGALLSVLPSPDVTAGGKDGPVGAGAGGSSGLELSMPAWTFAGRGVEYWLVAVTPAGMFSYDPFARSWSPGLTPAVQMPLRNIPTVSFPPAPAAGPGTYFYLFGVDPFANSRIDAGAFFSDRLLVIRR